jgi:hypothetical protein
MGPGPPESTYPTFIMDPSALTTAQLLREIAVLKELLLARIEAMEDKFALIESQRVEQKKDVKDAVDAALAAAKEAVKEQTLASDKAIQKSEQIFKEQLNQMRATFDASIGTAGQNLGDVKDRITVIESMRLGGKEKVTGLYGAIGAGVGLLATVQFVVAVIMFNRK